MGQHLHWDRSKLLPSKLLESSHSLSLCRDAEALLQTDCHQLQWTWSKGVLDKWKGKQKHKVWAFLMTFQTCSSLSSVLSLIVLTTMTGKLALIFEILLQEDSQGLRIMLHRFGDLLCFCNDQLSLLKSLLSFLQAKWIIKPETLLCKDDTARYYALSANRKGSLSLPQEGSFES